MTANLENTKDWFEFILDLDLLDNYFKSSKENCDVYGNSLIIQFLYHANMTEQVYANPNAPNGSKPESNNVLNQTGPISSQGEFKCKRIKILRILAIKMACLLDWNLLKFEKDIPVAVMSDLLHIFLRYTMENDEQKLHSQLDIEKLDKYSIFALQLLHRWCIRIIVFSKFLKRPPNKSSVVNVPGIVNPLQHMKDANENILKVLLNNVQESVDFIEKCLNTLNTDICIPTSECFTNLSADTGSYDIVWENASVYSMNVIKCLMSFDLGVYHFQQEKYSSAFKYLVEAQKFKNLIYQEDINYEYIQNYLFELNSYLLASKTMSDDGDIMIDENIKITRTPETNSIKLLVDFEMDGNLSNNNDQKIIETLKNDYLMRKLSQSMLLELESLVKKLENTSFHEQICECNLGRLVMESGYFLYSDYNLNDLANLLKTFNEIAKKLPFNAKNNISAFLQLYSQKIDRSLLESSSFDIKPTSIKQLKFSAFTFTPIDKMCSGDLQLKKFLLQTNLSTSVSSCIENNKIQIQGEKYRNKLKFFWNKWESHAQPLIKSRKSWNIEILEKIFVTTEPKEYQFYFISIAKIFELTCVNKYDAAYFILKGMEQKGFKNGRLLSDLALFVNVSKISYELDFSMSRSKQKIKPGIEKKIQDAKNFFTNHKSYGDIPFVIFKAVLSFLFSFEEYEFVKNLPSQNLPPLSVQNPNQNKKQRIDNQNKNVNTNIIEISKNLAKLCLEIEKNERLMARKTAREIWDSIIEIFTDLNPSKRSNQHDASGSSYQLSLSKESQHHLNRESLRHFMLALKNPLVSSILISLLSTIYNIGESMVNHEIFSEFRYLWPSSMGNSNSLNINSVLDILNSMQFEYIIDVQPFNSYVFKTIADIYFASSNYFDAFKFYLQIFVCETAYFTCKFEKKNDAYFEDYYEKSLKSMIKCCIQMNKHTHAALLSQMIENNQEYQSVFRSIQDRTVLTMDEMDSTYDCLWDVSLLEFFTYIHASRGHIDKRNKCLKLCASKCINSANSNEILEKTAEAKKRSLFSNLIKYYITV